MDLSRKWLNEFVDLPLEEVNDHAFAEAMSVSGSKVEVTRDLSKTIRGVVVGRIVKLVKHPNSDHMLIAQLDVGGNAPVQICTGAWNVHVGELVPAALDGALLPNGAEIRSGKLRGVDSHGMLCSLRELGMTAHDPRGDPGRLSSARSEQALDPVRYQGRRPDLRQGLRGGDHGARQGRRRMALRTLPRRRGEGSPHALLEPPRRRPRRLRHGEGKDPHARGPAGQARGVPALHRRRHPHPAEGQRARRGRGEAARSRRPRRRIRDHAQPPRLPVHDRPRARDRRHLRQDPQAA